MDCYTKPQCPSCQSGCHGSDSRQEKPCGSKPPVCPDMGSGPRPAVRPGMAYGPGPTARPAAPCGTGPTICPDTSCDLRPPFRPGVLGGQGPAFRPEVPMGPGPVIPSHDTMRFPVAMAYVPWQRWQQVYPIDRAMCRGTIFPDLDKPFVMGRCR